MVVYNVEKMYVLLLSISEFYAEIHEPTYRAVKSDNNTNQPLYIIIPYFYELGIVQIFQLWYDRMQLKKYRML